jgi:hypothetical protein
LTGGCDGSLVLANEAGLRAENNGLQNISNTYLSIWNSVGQTVSMADLIQVGGSTAGKSPSLNITYHLALNQILTVSI